MAIITKALFFKQLPLGLDTSDLSPELIAWLDSDLEDNILIEEDPSGQGGSTIWCRKLLYNGGEYIIDYITWGDHIRDEEDGVYIEGEMVHTGIRTKRA